MRHINLHKNIILAVIFGFIAGFKYQDAIYGFCIFIACVVVFAGMDKLKAPLGEGPFDRLLGIRKP